jgi:hypothetical protein
VGGGTTTSSLKLLSVLRASPITVMFRIAAYLSNADKIPILEKIQTCEELLNGFINYFQNRVSQQPTTINEQLIEYGDYN